MRAARPKHSDLPEEERQRATCRAYTRVLVRRGKLVKPDQCERCGSPKPQAHHLNYRDPKTVLWLCRPCHLNEHSTPNTCP